MTIKKEQLRKRTKLNYKKILKWISNGMIVLLVILVALSFYSTIQSRRNPGQIPSILGFRPMSVLTGSMRPLLEPGDMIVAKEVKPKEVKVNDVITYRVNRHTLVTHRVIDIISENGQLSFRTKGDANNTDDGKLVSENQLVGTLFFNIPKGGYIARWIRSPLGIVALIIIPIILLLGGELKNLLSTEMKDRKSSEDDELIKK